MKRNPITNIIAPNAFSLMSAFLLIILLFVSYFTADGINPNTENTYLFNLLIQGVSAYPFLLFSISIVTVIIIAFFLFGCNEKFSFIRTRTMMPSILFIFFILTSNYNVEFSSGLIGCLFLLFSLWPLLGSYQEDAPVGNIFNVFFFLSIGSLLCFDLLLFIPCLWISFFFLRIKSIQAFFASLIGILVPYILCVPIFIVTGTFEEFKELFLKQVMFSFSLADFSLRQIIYIAFLTVMYLFSFFYFLAQINADKIKTRQFMYIFYLLAFTILLVATIKVSFFANIFPILAMVLSILLGHYFSLNNSRFSLVLFIIFILVNVAYYFLQNNIIPIKEIMIAQFNF